MVVIAFSILHYPHVVIIEKNFESLRWFEDSENQRLAVDWRSGER